MSARSLVRFILKLIAALFSMAFYRRRITPVPCDIVFLYAWDGERDRTKNLRETLGDRGFIVREATIPSPRAILANRYLARAERIGALQDCFREYFAAYVIRKWTPRIVLSFEDGTPYTVFLKNQLERSGGRIINLAHGPTADTVSFTNFHFHYYFVFGQSSVDAVLRQKTRHGTTKLVKAGSYLIDPSFSLPPSDRRKTIVFFSTWLPPHVERILLNNFQLLASWARTQREYELVIKHHPLEDESIIKSILANAPRVTFLPKTTSMKEALRNVSLAMTCWSVASLEAAVLNRPTVIVNASDVPDFMEIEKYYLPRARSIEDIDARIKEMFARYDEFLESGKRYVARHLQRTTDSIPFIADCIESIDRGQENFDSVLVPATFTPVLVEAEEQKIAPAT